MSQILRDPGPPPAGYCPKCKSGYAVGPHVCPTEAVTSKQQQLMPCPFCGSLRIELKDNHYVWYVECADCRVSCSVAQRWWPADMSIPVGAWNRRAHETSTPLDLGPTGTAEGLRRYIHEQIGFLAGDDDNKPAEKLLRIAAQRLKSSPEEPDSRRVTRETIEVLASYIVRNCNYNRLRDHACPQCMPEGGDLVKPDFVCAYHLAEGYVGSTSPVKASGDSCPTCQRPRSEHTVTPTAVYCPRSPA
jgi:hypothetical protein